MKESEFDPASPDYYNKDYIAPLKFSSEPYHWINPRIEFYTTKDEHGYMSNFSRYPVELDGKRWPTSEHYYQAQKFADPELQEKVRKAPNPKWAANIGRDRSLPLRGNWEDIKLDVMYKVVTAKFQQHDSIRTKLLQTGNAYLVEHTVNDDYWADAGDGTGKNMLGKILMRVRDELRAIEKAAEGLDRTDDPSARPVEEFMREDERKEWEQRLQELKEGFD